MTRLRSQSGFALMELLVASSLMIVVISASLFTYEKFNGNQTKTDRQNEAQENARVAIDRLARDLRNLASPTPYQPEAIQKAEPYDLVFQSVDPNGPNSGGNLSNTRRVRYCISADDPSNQSMWVQQQTWTSTAPPPVPATSTCPSPAWDSQERVIDHVVNRIAGRDRPVWTYNSANLTAITAITTRVFVDTDPAHAPGESTLSSGVFLRNQNQAPVASFTATATGGGHVVLNGSSSYDPEGQDLRYDWYVDGAATPAGSGITYDYKTTVGSHAFHLVVSDPAGLTSTAPDQQVDVK